MNGALAQEAQIKDATHRSANQALDFLGAAALLASSCFPIAAGVG
jgi:hypothetical protein